MSIELVTMEEIAEHDLLDDDHQEMARVMRRSAKKAKEKFTMLDFAEVCLRATGRNYAIADQEADEGGSAEAVVRSALALKQAAVLYVYEALKACDIALIKEWPEFDEMLKNLVTLSEELP